MTTADFTLTHDQRNAILTAVRAIERQVKEIGGKPQWQVAWVISTNLAIIQANVTNMPRATSN